MQKYTTIEEFLNSLDASKRSQVDKLRRLIQEIAPQLQEHINWNGPSYVMDGEDRITFNLMNKLGVVKLILHMGATRKEDKQGTPVLQDDSGLIEWSSDIRGTLTFSDNDDVESKLTLVKSIITNWLAIPVK